MELGKSVETKNHQSLKWTIGRTAKTSNVSAAHALSVCSSSTRTSSTHHSHPLKVRKAVWETPVLWETLIHTQKTRAIVDQNSGENVARFWILRAFDSTQDLAMFLLQVWVLLHCYIIASVAVELTFHLVACSYFLEVQMENSGTHQITSHFGGQSGKHWGILCQLCRKLVVDLVNFYTGSGLGGDFGRSLASCWLPRKNRTRTPQSGKGFS